LQLAFDLDVGRADGQVDDVGFTTQGGGQVGLAHAGPDHGAGVQAQAVDGADQLDLALAHGRDADLHLWHTRGVQRLGDGQLLLVAEGHASGLLAVAQRGVIDGEGPGGIGAVHGGVLRWWADSTQAVCHA